MFLYPWTLLVPCIYKLIFVPAKVTTESICQNILNVISYFFCVLMFDSSNNQSTTGIVFLFIRSSICSANCDILLSYSSTFMLRLSLSCTKQSICLLLSSACFVVSETLRSISCSLSQLVEFFVHVFIDGGNLSRKELGSSIRCFMDLSAIVDIKNCRQIISVMLNGFCPLSMMKTLPAPLFLMDNIKTNGIRPKSNEKYIPFLYCISSFEGTSL